MTGLDPDDLTDEQIRRVLQTRGFAKMLAYTKLADGIEVLEEQDAIYDSMVNSITERHSSVSTKASVEEFFDLFVDEVTTYTEDMTEEDAEMAAENEETLEDVFISDE